MSGRLSLWILIATIGTLPILIWAAATLETNTDDVQIWLPDNTLERLSYQRFTELFGSDSEVVISWEGSRSGDPRIAELVQRLSESQLNSSCVDSVVSGDSIVNEIAGKNFTYGEKQLRRRLQGVFYSPAEDSSTVVVRLTESGRQHGKKCIDEITQQADATTGLESADLKLGGDVFTNSKIDQQTKRSLLFAFPAAILAVLITWCCLRNCQLVISTLFVAGYSALASVAMVSLLGWKMNGMLVIMPILILVLSLSACVHFCSYYLAAIKAGHPDPVKRMLQLGRRPSALAIATTAIGVAMLAVSHVPAVRTFAICSAIGLGFSLFNILVIFPAILIRWPILAVATRPNGQPSKPWSGTDSKFCSRLTCVTIAVLPFLLLGLVSLKTTLDPEKMFAANHEVNVHRNWLASRFSSINAIDLVATFKEESGAK